MGTRGTTAVIKNGEFKVAQYGQWDHYISGQGNTVLEFLNGAGNIEALREAVDALIYPTYEQIEAVYIDLGVTSGWITMEQSDAFHKVYPALSRDHGAKILDMIANQGIREIRKDEDFPIDSLMCEGVYVVDLDNDIFEVYEGFQETQGVGRFADRVTAPNEYGYWPVTLIGTFPLSDLPAVFSEGDYDEFTGEESGPTAAYADGRVVTLDG